VRCRRSRRCSCTRMLYRATYEAIYTEKIRLEINYVLEDNDRMNNALYKLGVKNLRRYRVYEMKI